MNKSLILSLLLLSCFFFACDDDKEEVPIMEISSDNITSLEQPFLHEAESRTVPVNTNIEVLKASSTESWCKVSIIESEGMALHVSVFPNTGFEERKAEVTLYAKGAPEIKIPITQWSNEPRLEVKEEGSITITSEQRFEFELNIASTIDFELIKSDWLIDVSPNFPLVGSKVYKFRGNPMNPGEREGEIQIKAEKPEFAQMSRTIKIIQTQGVLYPIVTSFKPTTAGKYQTITLSGNDFGSFPEMVTVYFNDVKAEVKSVDFTTMEVVVPRMPGAEECDISVVVGENTGVSGSKFNYEKSWGLSTVTGNGNATFKAGTLAEAQIKARYLSIDSKGNIIASHRDGGENGMHVVKINEAENSVVSLSNIAGSVLTPNVPTVGPDDVIYIANDKNNTKSYYTLDPKDNWKPVAHTITYEGAVPEATNYFYKMSYNPADEHFYGVNGNGDIVKIDHKTDKGVALFKWKSSDDLTAKPTTYATTFHPTEPNQFWLMSNAGAHGYGPWKVDVTKISDSFIRLNSSGPKGNTTDPDKLKDGPLKEAGFGRCWGMVFDKTGDNLYVSDENHLVRKIDLKKNTVTTIVGLAGQAGTIDGTADVAKLNGPRGLVWNEDETILYIADWGGCRIRKWSFD